MPCYSPELNQIEAEFWNVTTLLKEVSGLEFEMLNNDPRYTIGQVTKPLLDTRTAQLCAILKTKDVTKYSLEVQIWWRDHQKHDEQQNQI